MESIPWVRCAFGNVLKRTASQKSSFVRRSPDKAISKEDKEGAREVSDIITSQVNHLHYVTSLDEYTKRQKKVQDVFVPVQERHREVVFSLCPLPPLWRATRCLQGGSPATKWIGRGWNIFGSFWPIFITHKLLYYIVHVFQMLKNCGFIKFSAHLKR